MDVRIEDATSADIPAILGLVRRLAEYEKLADFVVATEADFERALFGADPKARALLAFAGGIPIGFALYFHTFSTFLGKPGIYLEDIFVEAEYRGKGIGTQLLKRIAKIARDQNCGRVEWSVLNWNQPSIDFYHHLGAVAMEEWRMFRLTGEPLRAMAQSE